MAKLLLSRVRLTDRVQTALKRLPEDAKVPKVSYEATAVALTQHFEPASKRELYKVEYHRAERKCK